jgi:O-succinylbenzoic acid--CoA ligase
VGGQSIPADLVERSENVGYHVTKTYGSAETSGGCVWDQRPIGDVVVQEIEGRLAVSGPILAHSYLDNEAKTRDSFREIDGVRWYLTDDAGSVDEDGRVHVRGRLDDVIVSGGVKIALGAIETLLHNQLGVTDAVVVGAVNDQWGHVPVVVTTLPLDLAATRTLVGSELGAEARPHRIVKLAEIPLLGSGKPDRWAITQLVGRGSQA